MKQSQANEADANSDKQIKPTASATEAANSTVTVDTTAPTEEGKRDEGERENGLTLTSQLQPTIPYQTDPEFDKLKRQKIKEFNKAFEQKEREEENGMGTF